MIGSVLAECPQKWTLKQFGGQVGGWFGVPVPVAPALSHLVMAAMGAEG